MLSLTLNSQTDDSVKVSLELEHSLSSISKWEQIFEKPFYGFEEKTDEEMTEYFRLMVVGDFPDEDFIELLQQDDVIRIAEYINAKNSGTTFREAPEKKGMPQIVTSEQIYSWLTTFRIPFYPVEHWHVNRMMNLIRIMSISQTKQKPMSHAQRIEEQRALNAARRAKSGSAG